MNINPEQSNPGMGFVIVFTYSIHCISYHLRCVVEWSDTGDRDVPGQPRDPVSLQTGKYCT